MCGALQRTNGIGLPPREKTIVATVLLPKDLIPHSSYEPSALATLKSWAIVLGGISIPLLGLAAGATLAWEYGLFGWADVGLP